MSTRNIRASENQDQYVLKVFLPLLAVAIILCGGACYYMERRRKRRIKEGKVKVNEHLEGNLDAAESVISAASSRRRHYLLPTQTTGRLVRAPSTRSAYSTYGGDPPPYEQRRGEPRSMSMRMKRDVYADRADMEYERNSGPPSTGGYGGRPLSRSRSMMDVRHGNDSLRNGSMRRSISSNNLDNFNNLAEPPPSRAPRSAYAMDDMYESASRPGSVMSDRRRVSPTEEWDARKYHSGHHPSSVSSFPVQHTQDDNFDTRRPSTSNLRRSMSQPNLARTSSRQSARTYPQGILKKLPLSDDGRAMSNTNSSDSGIKDLYGETPLNTAAFDRRMEAPHSRPTSRAGSVGGYGSRSMTGYERYGSNYQSHNMHNGGARTMPHAGFNDNSSVYSVSAAYHQHHPSQGSMHGSINHGYSHSFDNYQQQPPAFNGGNYWDGQQQNAQHMSGGGYHGYAY